MDNIVKKQNNGSKCCFTITVKELKVFSTYVGQRINTYAKGTYFVVLADFFPVLIYV